jgi:hypothetical protein
MARRILGLPGLRLRMGLGTRMGLAVLGRIPVRVQQLLSLLS